MRIQAGWNFRKGQVFGTHNRWDDTIKSYHAGDTDPSKEVRHFTQLVWKETSKLGCGVATCQNQQYFVCRYKKQGNWMADTPGVLEANVPPKK